MFELYATRQLSFIVFIRCHNGFNPLIPAVCSNTSFSELTRAQGLIYSHTLHLLCYFAFICTCQIKSIPFTEFWASYVTKHFEVCFFFNSV